MGICGGYQILGQEVRDPLGVEGAPRAEAGLGLLPVVTTMAGDKTTTQVQARVPDPGTAGCCRPTRFTWGSPSPGARGSRPLKSSAGNGRPLQVADGWVSPDRRVWGTYLHGLFDNDDFRRDFLARTARTRPGTGHHRPGDCLFENFQEAQLDRLADLMRRHLDMAQHQRR